jgi:hypothetical protein
MTGSHVFAVSWAVYWPSTGSAKAPIRSKKSRHLPRERPKSLDFLRGILPLCTGVSCCRGLLGLCRSVPQARGNSLASPLTWRCGWVGRYSTLSSPGEAESGSAGVQPDKEYPGRRCADGASGPWSLTGGRVVSGHHRTPESCLRKPTFTVPNTSLPSAMVPVPACGWSLQLQFLGDRASPTHLSGTLRRGP